MPERLPFINIAQMYLHGRDVDGRDGVPQRIGIVRQRTRIDQDAVAQPMAAWTASINTTLVV